METIQKYQIISIHTLLGKLGIMDQKEDQYAAVSNGRAVSSKDLTYQEANELISHLKSFAPGNEANTKLSKAQFESGNSKRRRILSICHQLPVEKGFTKFDDKLQKRVIDFTRLDEFLKGPHSVYKRKLNHHTPDQLSTVIVQFENMLKGYLK